MTFQNLIAKATQDKIPTMTQEGLFYCAHLIQSQQLHSILEVGTGHGIWSITMALADPQVRIVTIELNPQRAFIARENIRAMGLSDRIIVIQGDALTASLEGNYDLILLDGPKGQNKVLFEKTVPFLKPEGYVLIDNLDFHGETTTRDPQSRDLKQLVHKIKAFKTWMADQSDFIVQSLELGDGLMLVSRKYPR